MTLGPRPDTFELTHRDGDVFTFGFQTENAPPGTVSAATFDGDKPTLEYFDDDKMKRSPNDRQHRRGPVRRRRRRPDRRGQDQRRPARASRSVSDIVRSNVFTRINAILGVLFMLVLATGR